MGWKNSTILIRPAPESSADTLLANLGYVVQRNIGRHPYRISIGPGSIWLGVIGDCLVIETELAPFLCDDRPGSDDAYLREGASFKKALLFNFPASEIVALLTESVTGSGGFAVYRKGTLFRRWLAQDGDVVLNEGSMLPEEHSVLARSELETECEADRYEAIVFEIFRSLTGFSFDAPEVTDAAGSRFWLNDDEEKFATKMSMHSSQTRYKKWWKFWA